MNTIKESLFSIEFYFFFFEQLLNVSESDLTWGWGH